MRERLPARVWLLGWVSFFNDVASEMVYPIIPVFITLVLGAPAVALGAIEGSAEALVSLMKGWSGVHSDRTGKRVIWVQWGYGLNAFSKPLLGLARVWPMVFAARLADRFGKGLRTTARDALIVDSVERKDYGRAFGLHRAMDTAGALCGALVTIVLLVLLPGQLRTIFLVASIPAICAFGLTLLLRDAKTERPEPKETAIGTLRNLPSGYWRAVILTLIFGFANSSDTFLLLRANSLYGDSLKGSHGPLFGFIPIEAGVGGTALLLTLFVYVLYNVSYVGFSYPAGVLSDRINRWWIVGAGYLLYAGVYAGFAVGGIGSLWLLFLFYGIYAGLTDGVGKAIVADHSPANARGAALGFFYMASGILALVGNLVAGLLWDRIGPSATFYVGSGVAALVVILIPLTKRWDSKPVAT